MSSNNRASLLAGLRTGGVRSSTNPFPQSAAPSMTSFPRQDLQMPGAMGNAYSSYQTQSQAQAQAFQMQMMQIEIMRLQALQQAQNAQQYHLELARQQQQVTGRRNSQFIEPATAGPAATSFVRPRASQAEQLKVQLHLNNMPMVEENVPMTAALGGKFGGRLNPNATAFRFAGNTDDDEMTQAIRSGSSAPNNTPSTPNYTTVISGGTPLGVANGSPPAHHTGITPSKSDTALSWRRGSAANTVPNVNRAVSVNVKITPPPCERTPSPPKVSPIARSRPEPLRFSVTMHDSQPALSLETSDSDVADDADDSSSASTKSDSVPTTPPSGGADGSTCMPPLSPREVASKRLYEGLGMGRPVPQSAQVHTMNFPVVNNTNVAAPYTSVGMGFPNRISSHPMRQPRGPPSAIDELGPKNFASRIRRKAIGGLGAMLDARVNRREIEAF